MVDNRRSSAKSNILVFIDWYRPGYRAGGPVTSVANMVGHLGNEYHFFILTTNSDYMDPSPYEGISPGEWITQQPDVEVCYLSPEQCNRKTILEKAGEVSADTWYINGVYSRYFSILPVRLSRKLNIQRTIVAPRGMLSAHALGLKSLKKRIFLGAVKATRFYRNIIFQSTSEQETSDIQKFFRKNEVIQAPNLPKPVTGDWGKHIPKAPGELKLIFVGRVAREKNTLGALQILRNLVENGTSNSKAKISFTIMGQVYEEDYWKQCQGVIQELTGRSTADHVYPGSLELSSTQITVEQQESVSPDELSSIMRRHHFLFLPSTGENYGHAIVESMAAGLPVIISNRTPWKGLRQKNLGWDLDLSDKQGFAEALTAALNMDDAAYTKMSKAAHAMAKEIASDASVVEANRRVLTGHNGH